jgi:hypothetical protein
MLSVLALALPITGAALWDYWVPAKVDGVDIFLAPQSCTVGPTPPHVVVLVPQAQLDAEHGAPPAVGYTHYVGWAYPPDAALNPVRGNGVWWVEVSEDLPVNAFLAMEEHELAHIRGCEHGNITESRPYLNMRRTAS